jgi:hypothetical protein
MFFLKILMILQFEYIIKWFKLKFQRLNASLKWKVILILNCLKILYHFILLKSTFLQRM